MRTNKWRAPFGALHLFHSGQYLATALIAAALIICALLAGATLIISALIAATGLAALAASLARFLGRKLMPCSLFMRSLAPLAGNIALFLRVHGGETPVGSIATTLIPFVALIALIACSHDRCLLLLTSVLNSLSVVDGRPHARQDF